MISDISNGSKSICSVGYEHHSERRMNMGMSRKRANHLMLELTRRIYMQKNGNLKGFGKLRAFKAYWKFYNMPTCGYKAVWDSEELLKVRRSVGM